MLSDLIGSRIGKMVNSRDYRSAESLMDTIRSKYGRSQGAVIKKWQDKIYADAEVEREKSRIAYQNKNARDLHNAVRSMLNINPKISGGQAMFERTLEEFPLVFVGVTDKAATGDPASLLSWGGAAERAIVLPQHRRVFQARAGRGHLPLSSWGHCRRRTIRNQCNLCSETISMSPRCRRWTLIRCENGCLIWRIQPNLIFHLYGLN